MEQLILIILLVICVVIWKVGRDKIKKERDDIRNNQNKF